mmetsp:Transcript_49691/g.106177  ORF Transcript_49691/g.106177 Transcript_49691/m.106177 type:complete len:245 (+) Transcript_49691:508-1242(+)
MPRRRRHLRRARRARCARPRARPLLRLPLTRCAGCEEPLPPLHSDEPASCAIGAVDATDAHDRGCVDAIVSDRAAVGRAVECDKRAIGCDGRRGHRGAAGGDRGGGGLGRGEEGGRVRGSASRERAAPHWRGAAIGAQPARGWIDARHGGLSVREHRAGSSDGGMPGSGLCAHRLHGWPQSRSARVPLGDSALSPLQERDQVPERPHPREHQRVRGCAARCRVRAPPGGSPPRRGLALGIPLRA